MLCVVDLNMDTALPHQTFLIFSWGESDIKWVALEMKMTPVSEIMSYFLAKRTIEYKIAHGVLKPSLLKS